MTEATGHKGAAKWPTFRPRNLYETDAVLMGALEGALTLERDGVLVTQGAFWGSAEARELVRLAELHPPRLTACDPWGERIDSVEYHPARHALVRRDIEAGLGVDLFDEDSPDRVHRHALRAARLILTAQTDVGHLSVASTTSAALSAMVGSGDVGDEWLARAVSRRFDHRPAPVAAKAGVSIGLSFVERGASYPASAPETVATLGADGSARLDGHAWFLAAPMNDAVLIPARVGNETGLFLVPRLKDDGTPNGIRLERLKPMIGGRLEAVAEARIVGAEGRLVGSLDAAPDLAARALSALRFDGIATGCGLMRGALGRAAQHVRQRFVAGERLIDQPLMARVLADATLDVAAATALSIRIGHALDRAEDDPSEAAFARLMIPAARYYVAKCAVLVTSEALECLGGNGANEDHELARSFRDAPLVGLSGGAGNAMALDVLRLVEEAPETFAIGVRQAAADLDRNASTASADLLSAAAEACVRDQGSARILVEQVALVAAAAALHRYAPRILTDAFSDTRLAGPWRASHGMLDGRFDARAIVDWAFPEG